MAQVYDSVDNCVTKPKKAVQLLHNLVSHDVRMYIESQRYNPILTIPSRVYDLLLSDKYHVECAIPSPTINLIVYDLSRPFVPLHTIAHPFATLCNPQQLTTTTPTKHHP